jgi:hypothetical protein
VFAVIAPPGYDSNGGGDPPPTLTLVYDSGDERYEGTYSDFVTYGTYPIAIYAEDTEGNISLPAETSVFQSEGPDQYEDDDTYTGAGLIGIQYGYGVEDLAQTHTSHDSGDEDWVKFYGIAGQTYEIETEEPALPTDSDTVLTLYDSTGTNVIISSDWGGPGDGEQVSWGCPSNGVYYLKVAQYYPSVYGSGIEYALRVYRPISAETGEISGFVFDDQGQPIEGALITLAKSGEIATVMTNGLGYYMIEVPEGPWLMTVDAAGYELSSEIVGIEKHTQVTKFFPMTPAAGDLGTILGFVVDELGGGIAGAVVEVAVAGGPATTLSTAGGSFAIAVAPGTWSMTVAAGGYEPSDKLVVIGVDDLVTENFTMAILGTSLPTVSEWGVMVMALVFVSAGVAVVRRQRDSVAVD